MPDAATLSQSEINLIKTITEISDCNPFTPKRLELEKRALGKDYQVEAELWNVFVGAKGELSNVMAIYERVVPALEKLRLQILNQENLEEIQREQYVDLVLFVLYHRYQKELRTFVESQLFNSSNATKLSLYKDFVIDHTHWFKIHKDFEGKEYACAHLFALAYQVSRAFCNIYHFLIGVSEPMRKLRAQIWESIFTHQMRRYRRSTYLRMGEHSTLISGPSGTGKELVARALGLSRYIPFNPAKEQFEESFTQSFYALNLAAFPATLIESELFGHTKGAFTGATQDRKGWLELCGPLGTVFLDEIAEIDQTIQVKLLRVLESRQFQRMGDNKTLRFAGKIIAATNRTISEEVEAKRFRQDLYYRICADEIRTPSLLERIQSDARELESMVHFLTRRWSDDLEAERSAPEFLKWINKNIPADYLWPGNVRELDLCLRNLAIHGEYLPKKTDRSKQIQIFPEQLSARLASIEAPAEELLQWYCQYAYTKLGNFEETGRRLKLDRRTIKSKVI